MSVSLQEVTFTPKEGVESEFYNALAPADKIPYANIRTVVVGAFSADYISPTSTPTSVLIKLDGIPRDVKMGFNSLLSRVYNTGAVKNIIIAPHRSDRYMQIEFWKDGHQTESSYITSNFNRRLSMPPQIKEMLNKETMKLVFEIMQNVYNLKEHMKVLTIRVVKRELLIHLLIGQVGFIDFKWLNFMMAKYGGRLQDISVKFGTDQIDFSILNSDIAMASTVTNRNHTRMRDNNGISGHKMGRMRGYTDHY